MLDKFKRLLLNHPVASLCAAGLAVFGAHLTTVADYPAGWFDEIEILEMGRFSIFSPFPDWSVNLFPGTDGVLHPAAPMFHYLAGLIQESLYRISGSFIPARVFFLLSLPVAAVALFAWLRTKAVPIAVALTTAAFLLLDPNATICAHWYRPDLWTMSLAFAAMILLGRTSGDVGARRSAACLAAGFLTSVMLFLWLSSMLLLPLIGWEALQSVRPRTAKPFLRDATIFLCGFLLATGVLLIPLYPYIPAILAQYAERSELGGSSFDTWGKRVVDFIKIAVRSPAVWALALVGVMFARKFALHVIIFIGLCLLMLSTRVYHLRMVQLMPFLFLLVALTVERISKFECGFVRNGGKLAITLGLFAYLGLSVVVINYAAIPGANTFATTTERLRSAVPSRSPKVYLYDAEHELYYPGRALGWQMFSYSPRSLIFDPTQTADLIDRLDAVVISAAASPQPTDEELAILHKHGFRKTAEIRMPATQPNAVKSRLAALFYAHGYPDCDIYTRIRE